jgi:hypothetical protein
MQAHVLRVGHLNEQVEGLGLDGIVLLVEALDHHHLVLERELRVDLAGGRRAHKGYARLRRVAAGDVLLLAVSSASFRARGF